MNVKEIFKNKGIIISIAGLLILSLILSLVFIKPIKDKSGEESHTLLETESEMTIDVPEFKPNPIDGDSDKKQGKSETTDEQNRANLDVGGNAGGNRGNSSGFSNNVNVKRKTNHAIHFKNQPLRQAVTEK